MSSAPKFMTEDDWITQFNPLPNPVDTSCGYDFGDGCTLVETYGQHAGYLGTIPPERIWTVLDSEGGDEAQVIVSGLVFINRLGHIVTQHPWTEPIEVPLSR